MKYLLLLIFLVCFISTNAQEPEGPVLKLEETTHDFGDIHQGDKVEKNFRLTNSGNKPLIISDVVTTCGCTATKWTKEPILPGQSRDLLTTFNSTGKEGRQNKVITILSNASNNPSRITIVTNVLPTVSK